MWQLEEEGMTTKATLSSSSIECLVMASNFSYSPNKEIPKLKRLFVCWMLTGIKYCKLPPLVCKDSTQKEVKPMLWDKIESHSSHLCLLVSWSRISRDGGCSSSLPATWVAAWDLGAGGCSQFLNINNNRNSPGDGGTNIMEPPNLLWSDSES